MKECQPSLTNIMDHLILASGPPRSGTTLLAKILNNHDHIVTAIDNSVYESWGVYYYRFRSGLCARLRLEQMDSAQTQDHLMEYLYEDGYILGVAPSESVKDCPPARWRPNPLLQEPLLVELRGKPPLDPLGRRDVLYNRFQSDLRLCLKSPEIVFFLEVLAQALPKAQFVIVFRPIIEIAESMYRKGFEWRLASYHKRWAKEKDRLGRLVAPPGVPIEWQALWRTVSDFQRCVIYATSYLRALVLGAEQIPRKRYFLYSHPYLCTSPQQVLTAMAEFLQIDPQGLVSYNSIEVIKPTIEDELIREFSQISTLLQTEIWESKAHELRFDEQWSVRLLH
jgi:hypothetical protein